MDFFSTSVRRRVIVLLGGVTLAFVFLGFAWRAHERARTQAILEQNRRDTVHMVASVLDLRAQTFANFVRDYTFWDELVEFVATGDREWSEENLDEAGNTFSIDGLFVFDPSGRPVYVLQSEEDEYLTEMPLQASRFAAAFGGQPFAHFFARQGDELLEVHGAKIHGSDDVDRVGESFGYFFSVKRWDEEYVAALRPITGCQVATMWPIERRLAGNDASSRGVVVERDLVGAHGERVAVLIATKSVPGLDLVAYATNRALSLFVAFAVLALAALALGLYRFVGLPLKAVTEALHRSDPEPLAVLVRAEHEFGRLARMVREFFAQRASMLEEVERRRSSEQELARVCRRAESATAARMKMFAEVSHEIRSPLNGVIGMVDLLADTELDPQQREFVSTIQSSSKTMLGVLNDVLDFAKIEEGKVVLEEVDFDLREVIDEVVALFSVQAHGKGLELSAVIPASCRTTLTGDPGRIRQILINLVGNAVKYTASGEIVVEVEAAPIDGDRLRFAIGVRDTGVGIPRDRLDAIFEAYEQASASDTRKHGGTGLGLTISRHLARLLGGDLTVRSESGKGSTFTLECSLRRARAECDSEPLPSRVRAIVAARHPTVRRALAEQLKSMGCAVAECGSLEVAGDVLDQTPPATFQTILVADHRRDEGSLPDFVRQVHRVAGAGSNCSTIVTASVSDCVGYTPRADDELVAVLARPVAMRLLRVSVQRALARRLPSDDGRGTAGEQGAAEIAGLRVLFAESYPPTQRLLLDHARALGIEAVIASDGPSAIRALETEHFDVAVVDLRLIGIDGLEVARRFREIERGRSDGRRLPIVALNAPERERSRWSRAGIDDAVPGLLSAESLGEALARARCEHLVAGESGLR
jgi:signal transduction histidine kinase/CheY-like chemotaxis protein